MQLKESSLSVHDIIFEEISNELKGVSCTLSFIIYYIYMEDVEY